MKKLSCILLCALLACTAPLLIGCNGDGEPAETGAAEVTALREKVTELETAVARLTAASEETAAGNQKLKQQIDALAATLKQLETQTGLDGGELKTQIAELTKTVSGLRQSLEKSNASIEAMRLEIDKLTEELTLANGRITLLEGKVDGDPNRVYGLGDTVTYSNNGIKLFSITVTEAWLTPGNAPVINFTYRNYAMPMGFTLDDIFQVVMPQQYGYTAPTTDLNQDEHKIPIGGSYTTTTGLNFHVHYNPIYNKIYFGIAKADNVSAGDKQHLSHPFLPFAVFELDFQPKV